MRDESRRHLRRLSSEHADDRAEAVTWLADHVPEARPALHELAAGASHLAGNAALDVLARAGDDVDVAVMVAALRSPRRTWHAAKALARHPGAAARRALLDALHAGDPEVAGASAIALAEAGEERARPTIEELLDHPEESVRYRAVIALELLGVQKSREVLAGRLEHEQSPDVRAIIERAV